MTFVKSDLDADSDSRLDKCFIKCHESAIMYDKTSTIAGPESGHSFVRCQNDNDQMDEVLIFSKPPLSYKGISQKLKILSYTTKSKDNESKDSNCLIT